MAVTITKRNTYKFGNAVMVTADIDFDSSYPTGGEAITAAAFGLDTIQDIPSFFLYDGTTNAVMCEWDGSQTSPKLLTFWSKGSAGAMPEVTNTTNLSTYSGRIAVIGY